MLEKPDLPDQVIIDRVQEAYGLVTAQVSFLPLGYDVNTAVYHVVTEAADCFLKLRKGDFNEITVALPRLLASQGIQAIIAPLETREGSLWGRVADYRMILYPFMAGNNGYAATLSDQQWIELGLTIQQIHAAKIPPDLRRLIPTETFSAQCREMVRSFQVQVETDSFEDPTAARLAAFMQTRRAEISYLVERAGALGLALANQPVKAVLCHADLHPGNLLLGGDGRLYLVDWDNPLFAPKERDLMFVGAGMGGAGPGEREEALFYQGYCGEAGCAAAGVDSMALAYYRYERIIQDIAAFCEQLFLTDEGGEDREQAYHYFTDQFLPDHEVDIAIRKDAL